MQKGETLPLVPTHRIYGEVEFNLTPQLRLQFDGSYVGPNISVVMKPNLRRRLDPYFVANAQLTYSFRNADVFLRIRNMFDADYETYGSFVENKRDNTGVERLLGPGAPLGAFGGVRVSF